MKYRAIYSILEKRGREVPGSRYIRHTSHKDLAEKSQKLFSEPGVYES